MDQRLLRIIWMIWSCSLSLFLLAIPIARNLEYEYLWFAAIAMAIGSPWLALAFRRRSLQSINLWELVILYPLIFLALPSLLFLLSLCQCSSRAFYIWFAIQTYPAWLVGLGCAALAQYCAERWQSLRRASLALAAIQCLSLLLAIVLMWFLPQKRISHILLGFIHGPIYDSWLPLDASIIWSRFSHALLGLSLILIFRSLVFKNRRALQLSCAFSMVAAIFVAASWLLPANSHGIWALKRLLPKTMEHEYFSLHYQNADHDSHYEALIEDLFHEAQFHVTELRTILGADAAHVEIYVYPDQDRKKLWFGGGGTDITDVVTPSIHIIARRGPHPTLRHELVHALSSHIAFHGLGFHPNMALTEGLAVALAPSRRTRSLDEASAAMLHQNRLPAASDLMSPMFWTQSGSRAYTAAGSLLQFLIRSYGIDPVKEIYAGRQLSSIGQKSWSEVLEEWQSELLSRYPYRKDFAAEALYRYAGVFQDLCPHTKAVYQQGNSPYLAKLRQPAGWLARRDYWPWRLRLEPDDREVLVSYFRSIAHKAVQSHDYLSISQIQQDLAQSINWPPQALEDMELQLIDFDLLAYLKQPDSADALQKLMDFADAAIIGPNLSRQIWSRSLILNSQLSAEIKRMWLQYLAGWQSLPDIPRQDTKTPWIFTYLRNFRWQGEDAAKLLNRPLPVSLEKNLPRSFFEMWYLNIAYRLLRDKQWTLAENAILQAIKYCEEGSREKLEELARYSRFMQKSTYND